ncbi:dTDP-4-dehydrorhamnose reductase [Mycetohabitans endofungorum]|uniref:dTDP-4-dehydrorhamnose reductase n=1 Tax=Mycetohabitans endofungorum TaxID=417203 RepID=UPI0030D3B9DD
MVDTPTTGTTAPVILVTGCRGQLGQELCRSLSLVGRVVGVSRNECDLGSTEQIVAMMRSVRPAVVVNAAGYTDVDAAETGSDRAWVINAQAPAVLAAEVARLDGLMVHYSTDYVFDGMKACPYVEGDEPRPLSVYGRSKLDGERAVEDAACAYWIFRTSWVFSSYGSNFLKSIARLALSRDSLSVVSDQRGTPTSATLLADITSFAVRDYLWGAGAMQSGLYHVAAGGRTTWHEYALHIVKTLVQNAIPVAVTPNDVRPITTAAYGAAAARPLNSLLDTTKLRTALNVDLPDWREDVERVLTQLIAGRQLLKLS